VPIKSCQMLTLDEIGDSVNDGKLLLTMETG